MPARPADGIVLVRQPGQTSLSQIGCLQLARFINNDGLRALGGGLYAETDASGPVSLAGPGQQGTGRLRQSALEAANVDAKRELADLQELNAALDVLRKIAYTDTPPTSR
jgi:flagellar basal-body rod protein FlgG